MKLKAKINVYTAGMFILLLILLNILIYFSFNRILFENETDRSNAEALKAVKGLNEADKSLKTADLLRAYLPVNGMFRIIDNDNQSITTITDPDLQHLKDIQATFYPGEKSEVIKIKKTPYVFISIPIITKDGSVANLQLIESLDGAVHALQTLKFILLAVTIIAMIPVFLSTHIVSNIISRPILSMIHTMDDIQKSGKHQQISLKKHSKDELSQMGETFNAMIEQLEKNYDNQEQFIMNASHELKTPLTVIESYSDLLKRRGMEQPELFNESIEAIHSEAIRMRELTEQLLLLTKNDATWKMKMQSVSVVKLLHEITRHFYSAFHCDIELNIQANIDVFADQQKLKQLLYIFIENACKYSEEAVQIEVGKYDNNQGWIAIIDHGIGIPAEDLDKVFDRFYRVDKARTRKTGGFGLGLSLAKEIAEMMNVEVEMTSEEGKGTTVKLIFSLANSN